MRGKGAHSGAEFVDGLADAAMDDLPLQRPEEPLDDAVRPAHAAEGVAWRDARNLA